jgi:hypothetical protein
MPNAFEPYGRQEVQFAFDPDNRWNPDLYSDPVLGTTMAPQDVGFWGVTMRDKQVVAQDISPGNALTWVMNNVVAPILPGEQRYVSTGASMRMHEAIEGDTTLDGWDWLTHKIGPVQDVGDITQRLEFRDINWDAKQFANDWASNPENAATRAAVLRSTGKDLHAMLADSRNMEHAVYLQRYHQRQAQALDRIKEFDDQAGLALRYSSRLASGAANYLLTDPTFAPSLLIPFGGTQQAAARTGLIAAVKARRIGTAINRFGTSLVLHAPNKAPAIVKGGKATQALARGLVRLGESPSAAHRGLATIISHRGAVATEMAMLGGFQDLAHQNERVRHSEVLTDIDAYQNVFRWDEMGLAVGVGAAAGYIFGGRAAHRIGQQALLREAVTETAGGGASAPIRHSFDNVGAQGMVDNLAVAAKRAAERLVGDDYDSIAAYVLDDALLLEVGLTRGHMVRVLEELVDAADGAALNPNAVHRILADEITAASKARRGLAALDDTLGNQLEQEAFANALGRAARETPKATEAKIYARARELMAEELPAAVKRVQDRAARALARKGPARSKTGVAFWKQEAKDLLETAKRRDLLRHEMAYLARVEANLVGAGEASLLEGIVRTRLTRYTDGTVVSAFARSKASKVGRALRQIQQENALLEDMAKRGVKAKDPARINAMSRLRRAKKRLAEQAEKQGPVLTPQEQQARLKDALRTAHLANPTTQGERDKLLDAIFNAKDGNAGALWEDHREVSKFLRAVGLGGLLRKLARAGTGMEQSYRSNIAALRMLTQEFDHAKLLVDDLDPTAVTTHPTIQQLLESIHARTSEFADMMRKFDQAGRFGNYLRNPRQYNRKLAEFNRTTIRHIVGVEDSSDPAVQEAAKLWRKHASEIRQRGIDAGVFTEKTTVADFFPRRWNETAIDKNRDGFRQAIANHFAAHWRKSDEVHLGTLEAMGHAERVTVDGAYVGHRVKFLGEDKAKVVKTLKRSKLKEQFDVEEADYLKAIDIADADGWTPMTHSANRVVENLTGEGFEEGADGRLIRTKGRTGPQSEQTRRLEETVWADEALDPFLDWRFMENVDQYMRTTGMRVLNAARHQNRIGIKGQRMEQTIDFVERRWLKMLAKQDATREQVDAFRAGIRNLRQKLHLAEGRLPSMKEHVEGLRNYLSDLWVNSAGALYGQGIGSTIVTTEVFQSSISRIYGATDVLKRLGQFVRAFSHLTGEVTGIKALTSAELRSQMVTLGLTQRQFRLHAMERMLGQTTYNHGFQFRSSMKALQPWGDVWNMLMGKNNSFSVARRVGEVPLGMTRALASNMMQIGGLDFFSTFARLMHVQATADETARFFLAGKKMASLLQDPASIKALDAADEAAVQAAIAAGKTLEKAQKAGVSARMKVWKGLARKSGFTGWFGDAHWQIAEKWQRHGLLKPEIMQALEDSGAMVLKGPFKTLDFDRLRRYVAANPNADEVYQRALLNVKNLMTEILRKRVSEQSLMQTPTSQFARSPLGKVANSMTTWTRSFHDNNLMDAAQMPLRVGSSMMLAYTLGETMNMVMREMWRGKDADEIWADIQDDPDNYVMRSLTSIPWLGQFGGWTRPAADALTKDDRTRRIDLGTSAGQGAASQMADVLYDTIHAATSEEDVSSRTWRTASRFLPGYRTWAGLIASEGIEVFTGVDLINELSPNRQPKTGVQVDTEAADIPILDFPTTLKPDLPEDVSFLYPEPP